MMPRRNVQDLIADPVCYAWMVDLAAVLAGKDPVDAVAGLEALTAAYRADLRAFQAGWEASR